MLPLVMVQSSPVAEDVEKELIAALTGKVTD